MALRIHWMDKKRTMIMNIQIMKTQSIQTHLTLGMTRQTPFQFSAYPGHLAQCFTNPGKKDPAKTKTPEHKALNAKLLLVNFSIFSNIC